MKRRFAFFIALFSAWSCAEADNPFAPGENNRSDGGTQDTSRNDLGSSSDSQPEVALPDAAFDASMETKPIEETAPADVASDGLTSDVTDGPLDVKTDGPLDVKTDSPVDSKLDAVVDSKPDSIISDVPVGACKPVINEFQVLGADSADEFVEIYNPCTSNYTFTTGARLVYRSATGSSDLSIRADLSGTTIASKKYLLFVGKSFTGSMVNDGEFEGGSTSGMLAATGGSIALYNGAQRLDSVGYGTASNAYVEVDPCVAPKTSMSVGRNLEGVDSNNNSLDFSEQSPSPGSVNN